MLEFSPLSGEETGSEMLSDLPKVTAGDWQSQNVNSGRLALLLTPAQS